MSELLLLIYKDLATEYDIVMAILVAYAVPLIISLVLFIIHFGSERKLKKQIETFLNQGADIFKGEYILFSGLFITEKYLVSYSFSTKRIICFDQVKYIENQQSEFEKNVVFVMQDDCDKSLFSYTLSVVIFTKISVGSSVI